eukprot:217338-Rhodomonas_salina.1
MNCRWRRRRTWRTGHARTGRRGSQTSRGTATWGGRGSRTTSSRTASASGARSTPSESSTRAFWPARIRENLGRGQLPKAVTWGPRRARDSALLSVLTFTFCTTQNENSDACPPASATASRSAHRSPNPVSTVWSSPRGAAAFCRDNLIRAQPEVVSTSHQPGPPKLAIGPPSRRVDSDGEWKTSCIQLHHPPAPPGTCSHTAQNTTASERAGFVAAAVHSSRDVPGAGNLGEGGGRKDRKRAFPHCMLARRPAQTRERNTLPRFKSRLVCLLESFHCFNVVV